MAPKSNKRRAAEDLEAVGALDSPSSKRVRVDELPDEAHATTDRGAKVHGANGAHADEIEPIPQPEMQAEDGDHADLDDIDEEESALTGLSRQKAPTEGYSDLYLDTIDRTVLDFDFEKLCSVTLSNINVYACLVCGKYYQGRGPKSQAYFHALEENHHVYINMETKKVYVLPEGYEVHSKSMEDIKFVVDPMLSKQEVLTLDREERTAWDLIGRKYVPGFVGMNNIKANDYFNVVCHSLAHVTPLRNYFMLEDLSSRPQLAQRFSILVRKIWNPRAFKAHVSPHELLQEIALRSNKRFNLTEQSDPVDFLSWFLNNLHLAVGGSKTKPQSSIIQRCFQGSLKIESQSITARADAGDRLRFEESSATQTETTRYMMLTLDLPPRPVFQADQEDDFIPQVPLTHILGKYDGRHAQERLNKRQRYRLLHPLPPYLIFHIKRFSKNKFVSERNPTIVTHPSRTLDMSPYVEPSPSHHPMGEPIMYNLVANITLEAVRRKDDSVEGEQERIVWRVQLKDKTVDGGRWWEVQDLFVEKENAETLFTKESYVQVWERRKAPSKGKGTAQ